MRESETTKVDFFYMNQLQPADKKLLTDYFNRLVKNESSFSME